MKLNPAPGMKDIINESPIYRKLETEFFALCSLNGLKEIRTPILESKDLFVRSVGESSDIVEKEMFETGDLVLRPENTAPIVRAFLSQNLTTAKYCYFSPQFRKERPQKGRYRQFYHYGFEMFGEASPQLEIESLCLIQKMYKQWNLTNYQIEINYLGETSERQDYISALKQYFTQNLSALSEQSKKRLNTNVLRILDSKEVEDQLLIQMAPSILNYLSEASQIKWQKILELCKLLNIPVTINDRLVRGLDYYTGLVFEIVDTSGNLGSQKALGGGGRYDNLCQELGGNATAGFGFAGGVERLLIALNLNEVEVESNLICLITNKEEYLPLLVNKKSLNNLNIDICFTPQIGFKKMFKRADKLNAQYVVIAAEDEIKNNCLKIKQLSSGKEVSFSGDLSSLELTTLNNLFKD